MTVSLLRGFSEDEAANGIRNSTDAANQRQKRTRVAEAGSFRWSQAAKARMMENMGLTNKSTFNREFLRVTGTGPSEFRQSSGADASGLRDLKRDSGRCSHCQSSTRL